MGERSKSWLPGVCSHELLESLLLLSEISRLMLVSPAKHVQFLTNKRFNVSSECAIILRYLTLTLFVCVCILCRFSRQVFPPAGNWRDRGWSSAVKVTVLAVRRAWPLEMLRPAANISPNQVSKKKSTDDLQK